MSLTSGLESDFQKVNKMKLSDVSIHSWIEENNIKNERGEPLDFYDHLYLFDIYNDFSPRLVCYKAAQIGFSTLAIIKKFFVAYKYGLDIIYTLPTQGDVYDFVGGKVNRLIQANPILQRYVKDRDTMEQKRVGNNVVYYRGTFTEKQALMVTSDWNIHDEEDRSNQDVVQQYHSRLQHSKFAWEHHFSNPSVEGNGVSRYWALSDQKHWFIKCDGCKKEQYLSWPDSIDMDKKAYICKYCKKELSDEERRVGRWIARFKNRDFSGYWISLLMVSHISAKEVVSLYETKSKEYFWNFVLGLPYVGEGNKVTPDVLYRNLTTKINNQEDVVIGCDSGIVKHYVVGNRNGLFYYGKTERWEDIETLLARYPRSIAVIDALPDLTGPRKLRERYPGRVFLCHYARDRKTENLVRFGQNEEYGNVVVDRNRMIQLVIDEFADRRIPLQGTRDDWSEYYMHWDSLYRMEDKDKFLQTPIFQWLSSNGVDHWAHATVYWRAGMTMLGGGSTGEIINTDRTFIDPIAPTINPDNTMENILPNGRDPVVETLKRLKRDDNSDDWRDW